MPTIRRTLLGLVLGAMPMLASAQYRVFDWIHVNDGRLPANVVLGHDASSTVVRPVALASGGAPPELGAGWAAVECGPQALAFSPSLKAPHLSLLSHLALDRNLLGTQGRALYQADFFLPPKGQTSPTVSLLAAYDQNNDRRAKHWYRFGLSTTSNTVFFSYAPDTARPTIFHAVKIDTLKLQRPGWHRFQIIFEGRDRIVCAVDGTPVKFPEIHEPSLRLLNAGVFVASATDKEAAFDTPAFVDNISVQFTPGEAPIPDSPWTRPASAAPTEASLRDASLLDPASGMAWFDNAQEAWARARALNRPILVLWHVPRSAPARYLEQLMPRTEATRAALQRHVLLRIDVNQLAGGSQAQKFNIVRLPTLMRLSPDGQELGRLPVLVNQTTAEALGTFLTAP